MQETGLDPREGALLAGATDKSISPAHRVTKFISDEVSQSVSLYFSPIKAVVSDLTNSFRSTPKRSMK